jgi:hypothetical protein
MGGAVDLSQIGHSSPALKLLSYELVHRGEDGRHRHIHPNIDRPKLALDALRGGRFRVRDIGRNRQGSHAEGPQFLRRMLKTGHISRQ